MNEKHEMTGSGAVLSVKKEWKYLIDVVKECTSQVCGVKRVSSDTKNGSGM